MNKDVKISNKQLLLIVVLFCIGTTILITPGGLAKEAKQDAWIPTILGVFITIILVWIYDNLFKEFKELTFSQYIEKVLGKWLGKLISLIFAFFSLISTSILIYIVGHFTSTQIMPETPVEVIYIIFGFVVVFGVRLGIETLAKSAEILFPYVILLFILLVVLLIPQIEINNIKPVFEYGYRPIIRANINYLSIFALPLVVLLVVYPVNLREQNVAKKYFFLGILIAGLVLFIITLMCILVLGHDYTSRNVFPAYALAKKINLSQFIERIEVILAIIWFITIFYRTTFYFYASVVSIAEVCNLKDYRPLALPAGMLSVALAKIIFPNSVYHSNFVSNTWVPFSMTFGFVLPILLLVVAKIRKIIKR